MNKSITKGFDFIELTPPPPKTYEGVRLTRDRLMLTKAMAAHFRRGDKVRIHADVKKKMLLLVRSKRDGRPLIFGEHAYGSQVTCGAPTASSSLPDGSYVLRKKEAGSFLLEWVAKRV